MSRYRDWLWRCLVLVLVMLRGPLTAAPSTGQWPFEVLHEFGTPADRWVPLGALVRTTDVLWHGTTQYGGAFGRGTIYQVTSTGQVSTVYAFSGADGALPAAGLVLGNDGFLYGTTVSGGAGYGTVFRFNYVSRVLEVIHAFQGNNSGDGEGPYGQLFTAISGDIYGVTFTGGRLNGGTVFRIAPGGGYSILYAFQDGGRPFGGVVEGDDLRLYGTTRGGTIYRVSTTGVYEVVRKLDYGTEGATVHGQLVKGTNSNELFGTAREGGNGYGTIFKLTTSASSPVEFSVIYKFTGGVDGSAPDAGLLLGPDGNLYGTTVGPYTSTAGRGVYRVTPSGEFTLLHSFEPGDTQPFAPLMTPGDGSLYGVTNGGSGAFPGRGILYRIAGVFPASTRPFGSFDTPTDGATVAGEIPVTGWALDDSPIARVVISCSGIGVVGSALPVAGARPDVEALYPQYPGRATAGWGYMLLSNMLPGGGNGTFTLTATAEDMSGNQTTLGQRTIRVANGTSTRPFGTIDTPTQGAEVSGIVDNFGWALTPSPAKIPTDGSTITVYVDGAALGHPTYNLFRSDIAALFQGYANTNGAVGHFSLDTRTLTNGVHILSWGVVDDRGNSEGIGSRYVTIKNP